MSNIRFLDMVHRRDERDWYAGSIIVPEAAVIIHNGKI